MTESFRPPFSKGGAVKGAEPLSPSADIFAYGKSRLCLVGSRLHFPDVKIRKADFFLYVPQSGTYHVGAADISYEIYRAEGISCALRARGDRAHYFPTFGK